MKNRFKLFTLDELQRVRATDGKLATPFFFDEILSPLLKSAHERGMVKIHKETAFIEVDLERVDDLITFTKEQKT